MQWRIKGLQVNFHLFPHSVTYRIDFQCRQTKRMFMSKLPSKRDMKRLDMTNCEQLIHRIN